MMQCSRSDKVHAPVGRIFCMALFLFGAFASGPAGAAPFIFSTGNPDGLIATSSRLGIPGGVRTETADDFILTAKTEITQAVIYGLIPTGLPLANISDAQVAFYNVFPLDSAFPPSGAVPTRANSPSDVDISAARRDLTGGSLNLSAQLMNGSFTAGNSVVNGIHPIPNSFTGGEGPVTGEEVGITLNFTTPVILDPGHYFFQPQLLVMSGDFLWLSAPKPIVAPGTPFAPDLQSWIRDENLEPNWLRIGTDITGQGPYNAAFMLSGETIVPEPSSGLVLLPGLLMLLLLRRQRGQGFGAAR